MLADDRATEPTIARSPDRQLQHGQRNAAWTTALLMPALAVLAGCPQQDTGPGARPDLVRTRDSAAAQAPEVQRLERSFPANLPESAPWTACDGTLSVDEIPDTPLEAAIAGKRLDPVAQVVRGSVPGRSISFDFAQPVRWDEALPCAVPETRLFAGVEHIDERYAEGLSLPAGHYRLGDGWHAYYGHQSSGKRVVHRPPYYGLLVLLSSSGLDLKSDTLFAPTGRVRGKLAICFEDDHRSWIAGSFDVPACGDSRDSE